MGNNNRMPSSIPTILTPSSSICARTWCWVCWCLFPMRIEMYVCFMVMEWFCFSAHWDLLFLLHQKLLSVCWKSRMAYHLQEVAIFGIEKDYLTQKLVILHHFLLVHLCRPFAIREGLCHSEIIHVTYAFFFFLLFFWGKQQTKNLPFPLPRN